VTEFHFDRISFCGRVAFNATAICNTKIGDVYKKCLGQYPNGVLVTDTYGGSRNTVLLAAISSKAFDYCNDTLGGGSSMSFTNPYSGTLKVEVAQSEKVHFVSETTRIDNPLLTGAVATVAKQVFKPISFNVPAYSPAIVRSGFSAFGAAIMLIRIAADVGNINNGTDRTFKEGMKIYVDNMIKPLLDHECFRGKIDSCSSTLDTML